MRTRSKTAKLPKARENASHQIAIGVSFSSDWLREWCEFSGPITERGQAKEMLCLVIFDTQLIIIQFDRPNNLT